MSYDFDDELLSAYLDDELSSEERTVVERLLAERPEARRLLEELRSVQESLRSLPKLRLGDEFEAGVLRHAEREVLRASPTGSGLPSNDPATAAPIDGSQAVVPASLASSRNSEQGDALNAQGLGTHGSGERGSGDDWKRSDRWRRPLAWSILATAAAVLVMFVDSQRQGNRQVAFQEPRATSTPASVDAQIGPPGELHSRDESAAGGLAKASSPAGGSPEPGREELAGKIAARDSDKKSAADANGSADKTGGQFLVSNAVPTSTPAPSAAAAPVATTPLAGTPLATTAPGSQMSVFNSIAPTAGSQPAGVAGQVPATSPAAPPAPNLIPSKPAQSRFAVVDNLPNSGAGGNFSGGNAGGGGAAGGGFPFNQNPIPMQAKSSDLATQTVSEAVSQQVGYGSYAQIDTTPLVAANDNRRALSLLADYEELRRGSPNAKQAVDSLRVRLRANNEPDASRVAARPSETGNTPVGPVPAGPVPAGPVPAGPAPVSPVPAAEIAAKGAQAAGVLPADIAPASVAPANVAPAANDGRLVIVYCDVTPEAWERGLAPVLKREQIVDLTTLQAQQSQSMNYAYSNAVSPAVGDDAAADRKNIDFKSQEMKLKNQAATLKTPEEKNPEAKGGREEFYYVVAGKPQLEATLDALRNQADYFLNVEVEPASTVAKEQTWRNYSRRQIVSGTVEAQAKRDAESTKPTDLAAASSAAGGKYVDRKDTQSDLSVALQMPRANEADGLQQLRHEQISQRQIVPLSRAQRIVPTEVADAAELRKSIASSNRTLPPLGGAAAAPAKPAAEKIDATAKKVDAPAPTADGKPAADKPADGKQADGQVAEKLNEREKVEAAKSETKAKQAAVAESTVWLGLPDDFHEALFIFRVVDAESKPK